MPTCRTCQKDRPLVAAVVRGEFIEDVCQPCLAQSHSTYAAKYQRDRMREKYRREMVQRWDADGKPNPEFGRAYQEQAQQEFGQDFLRTI